eukprot:c5868_g1_i2.p1 GENE.c5868_g1_i2~~c5868_g1_i2.p1  ORF type:complete len:642 (-),score=157.04 c5868_g1_i2:78-1973(-)
MTSELVEQFKATKNVDKFFTALKGLPQADAVEALQNGGLDEYIASYPTNPSGFAGAMSALAYAIPDARPYLCSSDALLELLSNELKPSNRDSDLMQVAAAALVNTSSFWLRHGRRPDSIYDIVLPVVAQVFLVPFAHMYTRSHCISFLNFAAEDVERRDRIVESELLPPLIAIMLGEDTNILPGYNARAAMVVSLLVGDEEVNDAFVPGPNTTKTMKNLVELLNASISKKPYPGTNYNPQMANVSRGLKPLCIADRNKEPLVKAGIVAGLIRAVMMSPETGSTEPRTVYDDDTVGNLLQTIWSLTFVKDACTQVKAAKSFVELLKKWHDAPPGALSNDAIRGADGILFAIGEGPKQTPLAAPPTPKRRLWKRSTKTSSMNEGEEEPLDKQDEKVPHVMLSYCWADQKIVLKINQSLQENEFQTWMDVNQMSGSTLEAMASAIEGSAVVVMCVSEAYKKSNACRSEAEYAYQKRVPVIPLLLQPNYVADGWLGLIMGSKLYIDFANPSDFNQRLKMLIKELGTRGRVTTEESIVPKLSSAPPADFVPAPTPRGVLKRWTDDEVAKWVSDKGLSDQTLNALKQNQLDGESLRVLSHFGAKELVEFGMDRLGLSMFDALHLRGALEHLSDDVAK